MIKIIHTTQSSSVFTLIFTTLGPSVFTLIVGLITFKLFQCFKNKKANIQLYIFLGELKKELDGNKKKINDLIDENTKMQFFKKTFYINDVFSERLYSLYADIYSLNSFVYQDTVTDCNGDQIDVQYSFTTKPLEDMEQIQHQICMFEVDSNHKLGELEDLKRQFQILDKKNIYEEFVTLETNIADIVKINFERCDALKLLYEKLHRYNKLTFSERNKSLDDFCNEILSGDNIIAESLKSYNEFHILRLKCLKHKNIKLNLKNWSADDSELFAIYNFEKYLILKDLYLKLNLDINLEDEEQLTEVNSLMIKSIDIITNSQQIIKKALKKVNKLFAGS